MATPRFSLGKDFIAVITLGCSEGRSELQVTKSRNQKYHCILRESYFHLEINIWLSFSSLPSNCVPVDDLPGYSDMCAGLGVDFSGSPECIRLRRIHWRSSSALPWRISCPVVFYSNKHSHRVRYRIRSIKINGRWLIFSVRWLFSPSGLYCTRRLNVFPVCRKNLAAISSVAVLMFIPQIWKIISQQCRVRYFSI